VGDVVQESLANAFSGFGPGGALVGILAAAGAGALITGLQDAQEETDRLREKFTEMYSSAAEDGRKYLESEQIAAEVRNILFDPERADEYKRLREEARDIGVDELTYIEAIAGGEDALNIALEIGNGKRAERKDWADKNLAPERETGEVIDAQGRHMDGILGKLEERKKLTEDNKAAADLALEVEASIEGRVSAANEKRRENDRERGKALEEYYARASNPPAVKVPIVADTSAFDREAERIRRMKFELTADVTMQRRGSWVP